MTPVREAIVLPLLFLTVALFGGLRIAERVALVPPPLFALVLAVLALGVLVRSGALIPNALLDAGRPALANLNGLIVVLALFLATAQAFHLSTPESGVPHVLFNVFFVVLLANTLAAAPDRARVLRSLFVILGSGFVLKFIVLATLSNPAETMLARVVRVLFEGVTLGTVSQEVMHPAAGYIAFCTLMLYLFGLIVLPAYEEPTAGRRHPRLPSR
jgi:hypothetical protein